MTNSPTNAGTAQAANRAGSPTESGALPEWPDEARYSDTAEYRFDYIAALRARLELAVETLQNIDCEHGCTLMEESGFDLPRVIVACREPK